MRSSPVFFSVMPEALKVPGAVVWEKDPRFEHLENCYINGQLVAWLEVRPSYCDRGHWKVEANLPDVDDADRFPRYFMRYETAKEETEKWLKWRLWKVDTP